MDTLFRRQSWVIDLMTIVVVATLAGHSTATLIGALLPSHPPPPFHRCSFQMQSSSAPKPLDAIGRRNIFCSACGATAPAQSSRRALTLLAIMFAPPPSDPRWSVAVVRDDESATAGPFGVGARLGDARIVAIEPTFVVLEMGGGRRELLELLRGRMLFASTQERARISTFSDAVTKTGGYSYEVRRAALEQVLAGGFTSWPRVVPDVRNGESGLRLVGIRTEGPFAAIGLADGDRLLEVNGRSILTPDAALAAYASLRTASHVSLRIQRDGHDIRMDYVIR
jgi:general secretion pathway protein C